ncbi:HNH endonuclease signature motif containing protein, partial [Amycolatopsis tolypomycina]|uniref:HNH endonuclease signature motif containing protein n=1 Tax=Amycolatopsis tolypomycina TaxID=208445 RepID=UPI0033B68C36
TPGSGERQGETTRRNPDTAPPADSHWADGGPTDLNNLVLTCAHHHRLLHRSGWEVRIASDGLPEFLPPVFIDPRRRPRRNNLHEPLPFAA